MDRTFVLHWDVNDPREAVQDVIDPYVAGLPADLVPLGQDRSDFSVHFSNFNLVSFTTDADEDGRDQELSIRQQNRVPDAVNCSFSCLVLVAQKAESL